MSEQTGKYQKNQIKELDKNNFKTRICSSLVFKYKISRDALSLEVMNLLVKCHKALHLAFENLKQVWLFTDEWSMFFYRYSGAWWWETRIDGIMLKWCEKKMVISDSTTIAYNCLLESKKNIWLVMQLTFFLKINYNIKTSNYSQLVITSIQHDFLISTYVILKSCQIYWWTKHNIANNKLKFYILNKTLVLFKTFII